ncbi:MAG TPA: TlpA disulfide reductase family protein [Caldimonas sp.]|jgi:thiol-disulfide isomerase/thioredoxin|nr:TlpA disulfide reductase family protein [Caldimonas sp.]HEX2543171.1 TlpA disulfide reductase family protein [Caldimonas sp.]
MRVTSARPFLRRRRAPLLGLLVLVAAVALLQHLVRREAREEGALRFVVQTEPRLLPPLSFVDGDSKAVDLAQFRGRVVLLNLWATWCPPCRKEMPSLDRLQSLLAGEGLQVIALSIDKGAEALPAVRAFYAEHGLRNLQVYNDPEAAAGVELGAPGVPVTFLVDRQGREIGRLTGAAEWDGAEALALIRAHLAPRPP